MYKDQSDQPQLKRRRSEDPGNKFIVRTTSPQTVSKNCERSEQRIFSSWKMFENASYMNFQANFFRNIKLDFWGESSISY